MLYLIIVFVIALAVLIIICVKFKPKTKKTMETISEIYSNFFSVAEKYKYQKLTKTNIYEECVLHFANKVKPLSAQKEINKNKEFLITLSKFIQYKINSNNKTYRAKNGFVLIEQIANVVAHQVNINECKLFYLYKKLKIQYTLRLKEEKIFKILLGEKLLYLLFKIDNELKTISKIIQKSSKTKKIKKYKKQIYMSAQIYGIKKFNANSTKILVKFNESLPKLTKNLFYELYLAERKMKIILTYLTVMFN